MPRSGAGGENDESCAGSGAGRRAGRDLALPSAAPSAANAWMPIGPDGRETGFRGRLVRRAPRRSTFRAGSVAFFAVTTAARRGPRRAGSDEPADPVSGRWRPTSFATVYAGARGRGLQDDRRGRLAGAARRRLPRGPRELDRCGSLAPEHRVRGGGIGRLQEHRRRRDLGAHRGRRRARRSPARRGRGPCPPSDRSISAPLRVASFAAAMLVRPGEARTRAIRGTPISPINALAVDPTNSSRLDVAVSADVYVTDRRRPALAARRRLQRVHHRGLRRRGRCGRDRRRSRSGGPLRATAGNSACDFHSGRRALRQFHRRRGRARRLLVDLVHGRAGFSREASAVGNGGSEVPALGPRTRPRSRRSPATRSSLAARSGARRTASWTI